MLQRFRSRARAVASVLLVALATLGGVSAHGAECHDVDAYAAGPHDASAHRIGAPAPDAGQPLHCILCHWSRTPRPSAEGGHQVHQPPAQDFAFHAETPRPVNAIAFSFRPLRSPPAPPA